ncbi:hypothetical protein [Microbacterium wangruii]|uniref:hypothetical protein n=1 Tax=Microbacterium wangruii TaxID=3049073 RepID=UPI00256ED83D|nr:hypothetical protein [Microbacterium sp. zg-Y1211]MDL5485941.1 hypothetical protein [Microbacterium sp. zg-Y1211]
MTTEQVSSTHRITSFCAGLSDSGEHEEIAACCVHLSDVLAGGYICLAPGFEVAARVCISPDCRGELLASHQLAQDVTLIYA